MNKKVKEATEVSISTFEHVDAFIWNCINQLNLNFNPDTPFSEYTGKNGKSLFSKRETAALEKTLNECIDFCDKKGLDIYEISLENFNISMDINKEVLGIVTERIIKKDDIGRFLFKCKHNLGIKDFDIDTPFADYLLENGDRKFSITEATLLENTLDLCGFFCDFEGWDINEIADQFYEK